jgi:hypothetical protein
MLFLKVQAFKKIALFVRAIDIPWSCYNKRFWGDVRLWVAPVDDHGYQIGKKGQRQKSCPKPDCVLS